MNIVIPPKEKTTRAELFTVGFKHNIVLFFFEESMKREQPMIDPFVADLKEKPNIRKKLQIHQIKPRRMYCLNKVMMASPSSGAQGKPWLVFLHFFQ